MARDTNLNELIGRTVCSSLATDESTYVVKDEEVEEKNRDVVWEELADGITALRLIHPK